MKATTGISRRAAIWAIVTLALIFIFKPTYPQDTLMGDKHKRQIKVIVKSDEKGKIKSLDTVIVLSGKKDKADLQKMLREYEINLEGLEDKAGNLSIQMNGMDLSDSLLGDSLAKLTKRIKIIAKSSGDNSMGNVFDYSYNYEIPDLPEPPVPPVPPSSGFGGWFDRDCGKSGVFDRDESKGTLADILGDIPMDCVKSYSIKETKNGKRITIEVNNNPVIRQQEKIIIIHEPRGKSGHKQSRSKHFKESWSEVH